METVVATKTEMTASAPSPDNPYLTLQQIEPMLNTTNTRSGQLLHTAAPQLRTYPGAQADTLASQIAGFEFDRPLSSLSGKSLHADRRHPADGANVIAPIAALASC